MRFIAARLHSVTGIKNIKIYSALLIIFILILIGGVSRSVFTATQSKTPDSAPMTEKLNDASTVQIITKPTNQQPDSSAPQAVNTTDTTKAKANNQATKPVSPSAVPASSTHTVSEQPQKVTWVTAQYIQSTLDTGQCRYTFENTAHLSKDITDNRDTIFFTVILEALDGPDAQGENPIYIDTQPGSKTLGAKAGNVLVASNPQHPVYGDIILYPGAAYKVTFWANTQLNPIKQNWYSTSGQFTVPSDCNY